MNNPKNSRLIVVAQIAGAFGVKGEARVRSFTTDPQACFSYGPLMDEAGVVVLTPLKHRPLNEGYGVTAKETRQREEWEALRGTLLHAPRAAMPAPDDDEVYVTDLIGLAVVHVDGRALGVVADAPNFGAGDLLEVKPASGPSFFLPFTHAVVPDVDLAAGVVRVAPDEAMLPDALQLSPAPQRQSLDGETN
ncbi:MAG: ribosome maturation factor RimM [Alphaproteobacteria bacterium]